jgi:hypothetical protein
LNDEIDDGLAYGWQARLRQWTVDSFFPPRLREAAMLEECVSDHGHERMTMKALPASSLKVIKPEFRFQLTFCHSALASTSSAALDNTSGMCRLRGRPRPATGQINLISTG